MYHTKLRWDYIYTVCSKSVKPVFEKSTYFADDDIFFTYDPVFFQISQILQEHHFLQRKWCSELSSAVSPYVMNTSTLFKSAFQKKAMWQTIFAHPSLTPPSNYQCHLIVKKSVFSQTLRFCLHLSPNTHPEKLFHRSKGKAKSSRADLLRIIYLDQGEMSSCRWFSKAVVQKHLAKIKILIFDRSASEIDSSQTKSISTITPHLLILNSDVWKWGIPFLQSA